MDIRPKKPYLAVYDYGTGGVWVLIDAFNERQVTAVYPQLKVVSERPEWMTDEDYEDILERMRFDLESPSGWLLNLKRSE